jgi:hypothetical protein
MVVSPLGICSIASFFSNADSADDSGFPQEEKIAAEARIRRAWETFTAKTYVFIWVFSS